MALILRRFSAGTRHESSTLPRLALTVILVKGLLQFSASIKTKTRDLPVISIGTCLDFNSVVTAFQNDSNVLLYVHLGTTVV